MGWEGICEKSSEKKSLIFAFATANKFISDCKDEIIGRLTLIGSTPQVAEIPGIR